MPLKIFDAGCYQVGDADIQVLLENLANAALVQVWVELLSGRMIPRYAPRAAVIFDSNDQLTALRIQETADSPYKIVLRLDLKPTFLHPGMRLELHSLGLTASDPFLKG